MKAATMMVAAIVLGASVSPAAAQGSRVDVPPVPLNLEVPVGNEPYLTGYAQGTQNYICLATATGLRWQFLGPQATLFLTFKDAVTQQLTTHYLSANPAEAMLARPTWQHSIDSSRVWGRVRASSTDPNYVESGAIAWLLVEAAGTAFGPTGGSTLAQTTFIHRLNTSGGIAPSSGCSDISNVGTIALMPYTTDYYFYRASH